jgi:hypothetical protein
MRLLIVFSAFAAIAITSPAIVEKSGASSWGKAGVSLEEYARDAAECADTSRYVTTYIEPKTLRRLDALSSAQLLDTVNQIGGQSSSFNAMGIVGDITTLRTSNDIARRTNTFGAKYVSLVSLDVRDQLQAVLDRCLIERGYERIRLTEPQATSLKKLKRHSPERTAYLHAIGSDAMLVKHQRIDAEGGSTN